MNDEKLESLLALNPRYSVLSPTLFIGYQFTNILRFNRRHRRRVPQMSFSFLALARENVTFIAFVALDLTTAGDAKSFRRRSVSFNFGHFFTPLILLFAASVEGHFGDNSIAMFLPSSRGSMSTLATSST